MPENYCAWCGTHCELPYSVSGKPVLCKNCIDAWVTSRTRPEARAEPGRRTDECARCGKFRVIWSRSLCEPCGHTCRNNGTIGDYERERDGRLEDYADYRSFGCSIAEAAELIRKTRRTAERYEAQLLAEGRAVWRAALGAESPGGSEHVTQHAIRRGLPHPPSPWAGGGGNVRGRPATNNSRSGGGIPVPVES